ncbi:hypothetical protein F5X99DRAFT_430703 [Biscogniauxia marginata]|nr:hypothetical protein F5X99DRAFT_430703 [Biscogniauxia marginata]
MPHSDNLYSPGDDNKDYADQLSPSDGYFASSSSFNIIPKVADIPAFDPTQESFLETSTESKARETNNSNNTHIHRDWPSTTVASITSPLRYHSTDTFPPPFASTILPSIPLAGGRCPSVHSDAPPVYTLTGCTSQSTKPRSYSTFPINMGASEVENERLLGLHPESKLDQQPDDEEDNAPAWRGQVRRRVPAWINWKTASFALIILIVSGGLLANSFRIIKEENSKTIRPTEPVKSEPVEQQPVTEQPQDPGAPVTSMPSAPFEPTFCDGAQHRFDDQILALNFDANQNVTFLEDQYERRGQFPVRVGGQVNIRRLDGGEPRLVLEIVTNDPSMLLDVLADEGQQAMKVSIPKKYDSSVNQQIPCVEMKATIWVPENAEIGMLIARVIHLDVLLLDDLSLNVTKYTTINSVTGDISSAASAPASYANSGITSAAPDYTFVPAKDTYVFNSRIIEATTTSGKVVGNWPLYDMLGLHSTSNDVKVSITPKEEWAQDPKPAVLSLSTISGSISATEPVHTIQKIPLRGYLVKIKSTSGDIRGALAFGAGIKLKSTSSDIALDLLPVVDQAELSPAQPAQLETSTTSGTTAVRILEPIWFNSGGDALPEGLGDGQLLAESIYRPFNCLKAVHRSASGDIGLRYPQAWEGDLQAETTNGELSVKGRDIKILQKPDRWVGGKMVARKGPGGPGSTAHIEALTGTLDAVIGDE